MIVEVIKREFIDHIISLRFALTVLVISALMITNAVVHLRTHSKRVRDYHEKVTHSVEVLKSRETLYNLAQKGPVPLYKRPSSLIFIADGGEGFLPSEIGVKETWVKNMFGIELSNNWSLNYEPLHRNPANLRPKAPKIDWAFIITYFLSFIPLLFTFDSLAGERELGTLRLCLANPISRSGLLLGKFLGAFIAIVIPFIFAVFINVAIISCDSWTLLSAADWGRLGLVMLIAFCYAGIFMAIGLMVSAMTQDSGVSLVVLLLIWMVMVAFMPSTLGSISTKWMDPVQTAQQHSRAVQASIEQIDIDFHNRLTAVKEKRLAENNFFNRLMELAQTSPEKAQELAMSAYHKVDDEELYIISEYVQKDTEIRERLNREHLETQIAQVQRARVVTRLSPASIVQYALESMAGTGLNRHLQFLEWVNRYAKVFRQFIVETDRSDSQSLHLIGAREGMSKKPVSPNMIPIFEDSIRFQDTLNTAMTDIVLLLLLFGIFLSMAFLVFLRMPV